MFFRERAGCTGLEAGKAGFFRPDTKQTEIDGLASVNPFLFGIELFVAMADLLGRAVGDAHGFRAIGSDFPKVEFVVEDDGGVILGPASDAEGRLLPDGKVGLAVHKGSGRSFCDVDNGLSGGGDGPKVVVAEIKEVAAAGAFLKVVVVAEAILDFGASAPGYVNKRNVSGGTADGAFHGVGRPIVCN